MILTFSMSPTRPTPLDTLATQMADMTFESGQFRHLPAAFKREFPTSSGRVPNRQP